MSDIVRRVTQSSFLDANGELLPERVHRSKELLVKSQLRVGIEPRLRLEWNASPLCWADGFKLLIFRSTTGFSPKERPDDLSDHGQLVIESTSDDRHEECSPEGTHYFTCILYKKFLLGLIESMSIVRFSETVPSASVALGRIKDQVELRQLLQHQELDSIDHTAKISEARIRRIQVKRQLRNLKHPRKEKQIDGTESLVAEELSEIDAMVAALFAKREKVSQLKCDPRFRKLSREEQKAVLEKIEERFDAAEFGARREMRER